MQCLQVAIVVFGSREPMFFDYDTPDGFKLLRITYVMLDHFTFACLIGCTIYEPVFVKKCNDLFYKLFGCLLPKKKPTLSNLDVLAAITAGATDTAPAPFNQMTETPLKGESRSKMLKSVKSLANLRELLLLEGQ
jgi:hypothetical protein